MKQLNCKNDSSLKLTDEQIIPISEAFSKLFAPAVSKQIDLKDFKILESLYLEVCDINVSVSKIAKLLSCVDIDLDPNSEAYAAVDAYYKALKFVTGSRH